MDWQLGSIPLLVIIMTLKDIHALLMWFGSLSKPLPHLPLQLRTLLVLSEFDSFQNASVRTGLYKVFSSA